MLCFTHHMTTLDRLNNPPNCGNFRNHLGIYSNSKLCALIASNIFAKKLEEFGITSNALHPGGVSTSMNVNALDILQKFTNVVFLFKMLQFFIWKVTL